MFRRILNYSSCFTFYKNASASSIKTENIITDNKIKEDYTCEYKDALPFVPPIHRGYVIKVYDGDTITVASKLPYAGSPLYRFSVRLNHIDCPEMKSNNEEEKLIAKLAQKELENLILHKHVTLENVITEKYGRLLADVYINELQLNNYMLEQRLAVSYSGETKMSPKSWNKYHLTGEH